MHWDIVDRIHNDLPLGGKKRIFLDSMGDWFSEGVEPTWIYAVVQAIKSQPTYKFLVLTKSPENIGKVFGRYDVPSNLWLGVTVTEQTDTWRQRPASPAEDRHTKELQRAERIAQKADAAQRLAKMGKWR